MKHLRKFETTAAFEAAKPTLEDPWVALTEEDEKVHFMDGIVDDYTLNPNWYLQEGGKYYQLKQKEDGTATPTVTLLDEGWELTGSDDEYYYYKTIESYIDSNEWAQIKISWSGATEMNFKYKSVCTDGDESYDYLEVSTLDAETFTDNPRFGDEHIAEAAIGQVIENWKDYSVKCDGGEHSVIFVFSTDGKCDGDFGEIAIPKEYVTYLVKKGNEIPTTYATDGKSAKIISGVPSKVEYKAITLPNGNDVFVDMTDTQETEATINTEYVDLGLPSGLKWASANIGAEKESDFGVLFAWGQTDNAVAPKFVDSENYPYNWATAPFNNGSSSYDSSYFTAHKSEWLDGDILKPEYDAATQNMGEGWRMPTKADYDELLANTTNEWTQVNGVNGRRFTGSNGNSIFIPAAGNGNSGSVYYVGSNGRVWSSSLLASSPGYGRYLYFHSGYCFMGNGSRFDGFSVRGVHS